MVCKGLKVGVIIEKAEAECTVVTTYGRRNTYFVVFYDAFPVCAQAESLGGIGTLHNGVERTEKKRLSLLTAAVIKAGEVYFEGGSPKRVIERGEKFKMFFSVPVVNVYDLFHDYGK
ncbi:chloramphenicol acetyltransferase [Prevotella sp. MGM2]|nr:chloramphenicol acetyltransferase [Prevotella sp. MGM2]